MTEKTLASSEAKSPDNNWLATLGSWLSKPMRALLRPWWDQLVETKAESQALRIKVMDAIVRFRVADYQRRKNLDPERAIGIAQRVIEQFRPTVIADQKLDPVSPDFLCRVETEIQIHGVVQQSWTELACLAFAGSFDPQHYLIVRFLDDRGSRSESTILIAALAGELPFTRILTSSSPGQGRLSSDAVQLLREYCARKPLPEARYQLSDKAINLLHEVRSQFADKAIDLPKGWSPS
jgi:hypothetical protein